MRNGEVGLHGLHTFPKSERLQYGHQFRQIYERGRKVEGRLLALYLLDEPSAKPAPSGRAVGVVTGRKLGGAVQRNRARRLLREAYRLNKHKLKPNIQIVMVARYGIRGKRLPDVEAELLGLFGTAGMLSES
ncbi:MAG: ribonuclease P protein component [Verrucomicrobiia bacterium]